MPLWVWILLGLFVFCSVFLVIELENAPKMPDEHEEVRARNDAQ